MEWEEEGKAGRGRRGRRKGKGRMRRRRGGGRGPGIGRGGRGEGGCVRWEVDQYSSGPNLLYTPVCFLYVDSLQVKELREECHYKMCPRCC